MCIYSCQQTSELREIELKNIIKGIALTECGTSPRHTIYRSIPKNGITLNFLIYYLNYYNKTNV